MKHLSIIRHAKAARPQGYASDFERPLTKRGANDASLIGEQLSRLTPKVDWLISSPSERTQQTVERLVDVLEYEGQVFWEQKLYGADAGAMATILSSIPPEIDHAAVVGHNPGLEGLVSGLCTGSTVRLNLSMPTAAVAHLELDIYWWNQIRWGCGQLQILLKPKLFRARLIAEMSAPKTAAMFDLDKTLLSATSARLFISYLRHRGILWRYLRKQAVFSAATALIGFRLGIMDTTRAMQRAAKLSAGSNVEELWELVGQWFDEMVRPMISSAGLSALAWHQAQGHVPIICSASSQFSVMPVADYLNIDHTIYTEWLSDGDVLSGELRLPVAYGAGKVHWAKEWASTHNVDLAASYFYSDHISDRPLLEAVGHPVAVNPEFRLQELAHRAIGGW